MQNVLGKLGVHSTLAAVALALYVQAAAVHHVVVAEALEREIAAHHVERAQVDALVRAEQAKAQRGLGLDLPAPRRVRRAQREPRETDFPALEHDPGPDLLPRPPSERARRGRGLRAGVAEVRTPAGAAGEQGERQTRGVPPHFQPPTAFLAASFSGRISSPVADTLTTYCAPSAIGTYAALP